MRLLLLVLLLVASGCGFQLRGTADVPFDTVYLPSPTAGVQLDLRRNIQAGTRAKVVDNPKDAQAIMEFMEETKQKEILSLTSTGRVREFRLVYRVRFRVHDGKSGDYLAPQTITLFRDVSFNDSDILAKETEEQLLFRDMQADMVSQIMRRLSAAQTPKPQ